MEKLQVTLRGIETLSVVARDTASKLTELIGAEEVHCTYMCAFTGVGTGDAPGASEPLTFWHSTTPTIIGDVHIYIEYR